MKPKEFDELVRQKFDRNDFAYDPENWDRLAEKLEGRDKKRSIIMWWWVPLAGMAASVALAMGLSTLLHQQMPGNTAGDMAQATHGKNAPTTAAQHGTASYLPGAAQNQLADAPYTASAGNTRNSILHFYKHTTNKHTAKKVSGKDEEDSYGINLTNATGNKVAWQAKKIDLTKETTAPDNKNKKVAVLDAVATFKPEEEVAAKPSKLSIILLGGVNRGNQNSGYTAGGTIRRMVNDKVYIESDVAFASSTNTQSTEYVQDRIPVAVTSAARHVSTAKTTVAQANKAALPMTMEDVIGEKNISYDLYYAQVSPSIGYKVIKKMSIALGPDFQKMLGDNRPAPSSVDRNNIQVAPTFDVGFIGKTEYALTKKVRAGVYYRKGVNNIITPMDKFIDRDYVQFQVKYTIFNK